MEELQKGTEVLKKHSRCPSRGKKLLPFEYKPEALKFGPVFSAKCDELNCIACGENNE
jgi:hypothetical protein